LNATAWPNPSRLFAYFIKPPQTLGNTGPVWRARASRKKIIFDATDFPGTRRSTLQLRSLAIADEGVVMRVARPLATLRYALLLPLALAALVSTPTFAQTEVIIRDAPPPMRVEAVPVERPGYVWDRGHWRYEGRGYVWVPGHWQPVMRNARWEPGHWESRGPNWFWIEGHWIR
jgi:hypothetical protein